MRKTNFAKVRPLIPPSSIRGIRVTPNVYQLTAELDRFVYLLSEILKKGKTAW